MRVRDQSSIFSIGGKFSPDCGLLLELHPLSLVPVLMRSWYKASKKYQNSEFSILLCMQDRILSVQVLLLLLMLQASYSSCCQLHEKLVF